MSNIPKLSASEVSSRMGRMSPRQATSFYNRCMVNPDTPQENILLLRQYREQNPDRFLSDEQMRSSRGSTGFGSRKGGWFREKGNHVIDGDGFSYDRDGNRYDAYGNADTGFVTVVPDGPSAATAIPTVSPATMVRPTRDLQTGTATTAIPTADPTGTGVRSPRHVPTRSSVRH